MLPFSKPRRSVSQAPLKPTQCVGGCGSTVFYRTNSRKFCETCRSACRTLQARAQATKKRRCRGIAQVKGVEAPCDRCGCSIIRTVATHRFCEACSPIAALDYSREYQRRKHRDQGREQVGTEKPCANCGNIFAKVKKGRQIYCGACMALQKANKLPSLRVSFAKWRRNKYATDPKFALNELMRRGILSSLEPGVKNGRRWESLVGYTVEELKRHIERQFLPDMSWSRRPEIHIDHIVPLASFKFDGPEHPEFRAAWALTNLRPLWGPDNIRKRAQRTHLL